MTVHSRATLTKHKSCHLFALSLINTHKRREDFTAENINNVLKETRKIGLSIYESIHKNLHKAATYLTLLPEHYCGCKELFSVMCDGTERGSWCAALAFWFSMCMLVLAQATCGLWRCAEQHTSQESHMDMLHLWLRDLLRPSSPAQMLVPFTPPGHCNI